MRQTFLLIGSILGTVTFLWRIFDTITSHVSLRIEMRWAFAANGAAHLGSCTMSVAGSRQPHYI
jgi:hypothetical protein